MQRPCWRFASDELTAGPILGVTPEALHFLIDYPWPGNIRELQNALQYVFVKCKSDSIHIEHLPPEIFSFSARQTTAVSPIRRRGKLNFVQVKEALEQTNGNKVKAAKLLGVGRATLYRFLKDHGQV